MMSDESDRDVKEPDKYVFMGRRVMYYNVKYDCEVIKNSDIILCPHTVSFPSPVCFSVISPSLIRFLRASISFCEIFQLSSMSSVIHGNKAA